MVELNCGGTLMVGFAGKKAPSSSFPSGQPTLHHGLQNFRAPHNNLYLNLPLPDCFLVQN